MNLLELLRKVCSREEILEVSAAQDAVDDATLGLREAELALSRKLAEMQRRHRGAILDILPPPDLTPKPAALPPGATVANLADAARKHGQRQ